MKHSPYHLGLDLGSISLKAALIDAAGAVVFSRWRRVAGAPREALTALLEEMAASFPDAQIASVGATGSGRGLLEETMGAVGINEISAQAAACAALSPEIRAIIEIGGQDSKLIVFDVPGHGSRLPAEARVAGVTGHGISHFSMNELCAAGTGAFLDQQAARLSMPIEAFSRLAQGSTDPVPIAGRCAVFAKTDMTHHQQEGRSLPDIVAGLNEALVRSYCSNMVRGRTLPRPISFQGGVASNEGLARAFRKILGLEGDELIVPEQHRVMGAIGAAMLAAKCRGTCSEDGLLSLRQLASPQRGFPRCGTSSLETPSCRKVAHAGELPAPPAAALFTATESGGLRRRSRNPSSEHVPPHVPREGGRLLPSKTAPIAPDFSALAIDGLYLGIDVGSVSVKVAALSPEGVLFQDYRFSEGRPIDVLREIFSEMERRRGRNSFAGVGITGSGRHFIGKLLGADAIVNEITAQARAAAQLLPGTDTVLEIGGQDAKFMRIEGPRATSFTMNRVCAAGTGAFLQEQAARLNVDIEEEFSREAFASTAPAELGGRCTVFMESDLVAHQQQGFSRRDLIAGLARSVVANYLEKVAAGRPVGKRTLFVGGVAENRAVVAALEAVLARPVATTTAGRISGAIGAAMLAFEARRAGRFAASTFTGDAAALSYEHFLCEECPNRCRICATKTAPRRTFGGRCGRWEEGTKRCANAGSLIRKRRELLEGRRGTQTTPHPPLSPEGRGMGGTQFPLPNGERVRVRGCRAMSIGIPRALLAYDRLPAWRRFFTEAGCEVVLSPPSDTDLLTEGMKHLVVENCLPAKAFCAHLHWLSAKSDVDAIFIPSFVSTGEDRHGKETVHCPYIQGLRALAGPVATKPLLSPSINWKLHPRDEERAMLSLAPELRISRKRVRRAWKKAQADQRAFREELRAMGRGLLAELAEKRIPRAFVILGKDYNVNDPALNSRAVELLEAMGEVCCTQDMLADDSGSYSPAYRTMCWSHGKEILAAAEIAAKTPDLYPIYITSFGCGPDSFTIRSAQDIMGEKPILVLEVDEHSSSVGMETRLEAFLDSLPNAPAKRDLASARRPASPLAGIRTVYLPNFSDHSYAFAAAIRSLGLIPRLTAIPGEEAARLGGRHVTAGECHPYTLMLGAYLQTASGGEDLEGACYFMPESGACRVGLFGSQMRLVAEDAGAALPIVTRIQDLAPSLGGGCRRLYVRALTAYWEMMRGMDFALQLFYETRAHEVVPGSAERARGAAREALMARVLENRPVEGLCEYRDIIAAVKTDRSRPRVRIGITGDYYTRISDASNSNLFLDIERLGGVVMLPPTMSEFVKYDSHQKPAAMLRHGRLADALQSLVVRGTVGRREKRIRALFDGAIDYDIPLEYGRAMELIAPYMDHKPPAGLTGSVAAILEQIRAGADGVLNLITFHCTYGLILSSTLASIGRDHPDVPRLTLIFEGLKPTHNRTRLEAFMERVREKASRQTANVGT